MSTADLIGATLARLDLGADGAPHEQLALDAVWLALTALGERVRAPLAELVAGTFWEAVLQGRWPEPGTDPLSPAPVGTAGRPRVAVALVLLRAAGEPDGGAAERTAAALACTALGVADPDAGAAVQRGLGDLRLLELVSTVPVAARVRSLALEFRYRNLERRLPAKFVARVQDLLERLDAESLLAVRLADCLGPARREGTAIAALVRSASPRVTSLTRALSRAAARDDGPLRTREALLEACLAEAPDTWRRFDRAQGLREVELAYEALGRALEGSSFALLPGGRKGFGLAREAKKKAKKKRVARARAAR
jgi:hypothetical protein